MPNWKIHNRWAKEMGISGKVSQQVNWAMDWIPRHEGKPVDFEALNKKGAEYKKAWMLHDCLDKLEASRTIYPEENEIHYDAPDLALTNLKQWKEEEGECPERDIVEHFVQKHLLEIFADLEETYGGRRVTGPQGEQGSPSVAE